MNAGAEISLRIGQRVRHQDFKGQRVTGIVTAIALNGRELMVDVALDAPIVIPEDKFGPGVTIRHQHAPAHEYQPFDERDELVADLTKELSLAVRFFDQLTPTDAERMRKVLEKAGGAS